MLLTWEVSPTSGIVYYRIYRSAMPGGPYELAGMSTETSYTNSGLVKGQTYCYRGVSAVDSVGTESPYSNEASATPQRAIRYHVQFSIIMKQ